MPPRSPLLLGLPEALEGPRGPRVRLRPYTTADAPAVFAAVAESREYLGRWLPWAAEYDSVEASRQLVVRLQAAWPLRDTLTVGVFDRAMERLLGGCGLHHIDWQVRAFELGYWLRHSAEGRGFITEAAQLLTRLAFATLAANRVEIRVDPANTRSCRVAERLGFVLEGRLRRCVWGTDGRPTDRLVFALIPEDYQRLPWASPV
jgi:RimJ/RimL family protein N-acetyltransferase